MGYVDHFRNVLNNLYSHQTFQVSRTVLYFTETLWPEFSLYGFIGALIHFHLHAPASKTIKENNERKNMFLNRLDKRRWHEVENFVNCPISNTKGRLQNIF